MLNSNVTFDRQIMGFKLPFLDLAQHIPQSDGLITKQGVHEGTIINIKQINFPGSSTKDGRCILGAIVMKKSTTVSTNTVTFNYVLQ